MDPDHAATWLFLRVARWDHRKTLISNDAGPGHHPGRVWAGCPQTTVMGKDEYTDYTVTVRVTPRFSPPRVSNGSTVETVVSKMVRFLTLSR